MSRIDDKIGPTSIPSTVSLTIYDHDFVDMLISSFYGYLR